MPQRDPQLEREVEEERQRVRQELEEEKHRVRDMEEERRRMVQTIQELDKRVEVLNLQIEVCMRACFARRVSAVVSRNRAMQRLCGVKGGSSREARARARARAGKKTSQKLRA